jgi:hypothetical protein
MKPIVLILPGGPTSDYNTIIVLPSTPDSHTEESWKKMPGTIADEYIRRIDANLPREASGTLAMIEVHPEWKCQATEGISIPTWCLVE